MRVIGGSERGRRLRAPRGRSVRPTPDRVRETLFNWLQGEVEGEPVLDLFAGSGALGIESLSRGASFATFVENNRGALEALEGNLEGLSKTGPHDSPGSSGIPPHESPGSSGFPPHDSPPRGGEKGPLGEGGSDLGKRGPPGGGRFEIVRASAWQFLEGSPDRTYGIVFLDPPFGRGWAARAAARLEEGGWLQPGVWVYLETAIEEGTPEVPVGWRLHRSSSCGDVASWLFRRPDRKAGPEGSREEGP